MLVVILSAILLLYFSGISARVPCTLEIKWIPESIDAQGKWGLTSSQMIFSNDLLEAIVYFDDINNIGSNSFLSLNFFNKSKNRITIDNIKTDFLIEHEPIAVKELSAAQLYKCNSQPCQKNILKIEPINIDIPAGSVERLKYTLDYKIDSSSEKAEAHVAFTLNVDGSSEKIKEIISLKKYSRRYNCIWGKGHPYKEIR